MMVTTALAPDARPRLAEAAVAANDDLLSGISEDMRVLQESTDPRAIAAVEYLVYAQHSLALVGNPP